MIVKQAVRSRRFRKRLVIGLAIAIPAVAAGTGVRTWLRYRTADVMVLPIREFSNAEYPEDPAARSVWYGMYQGRRLRLERRDEAHFDFTLEPLHPHIATIEFKNVDVSLMTPNLPEWTKGDPGLRRIALTDRQWNRQQVRFGAPTGDPVSASGGDGREARSLVSAELAKNCLNAGLWEVLLFVQEDGEKKLYYQGWFTFPLGFYRDVFNHNTGLSYLDHWYYLEHWFDPAGTVIALTKLREVLNEKEVPATFDPAEPIVAFGEQQRKRRTTMASNVANWGDVYQPNDIHFASFVPPGRYSLNVPWNNEYPRMERFEQAILRKVRSPAANAPVDELELVFSSRSASGKVRFLVSGFRMDELPQLPVEDYSKGLYMPMGIGVPPFFQDYKELAEKPPNTSAYFSVLLDDHDRWVDHHHFAIDGPVLIRDHSNPQRLHLYLLSYERHSLIGHWVIDSAGQVERGPSEHTAASE